MKLKLHHINVVSRDVSGLAEFYSEVLDLKPETRLSDATRTMNQGYAGKVAFLTDGETQFHLAEQDLGIGFRTQQAVNPVLRGHIAFRTDDIAAFKARLEARGIPYSDFGKWAIRGWHQIFFYDPEGNVVEVHQADENAI